MAATGNGPKIHAKIHGIISAFKVDHSLDTYWTEDHTEQEKKVRDQLHA